MSTGRKSISSSRTSWNFSRKLKDIGASIIHSSEHPERVQKSQEADIDGSFKIVHFPDRFTPDSPVEIPSDQGCLEYLIAMKDDSRSGSRSSKRPGDAPPLRRKKNLGEYRHLHGQDDDGFSDVENSHARSAAGSGREELTSPAPRAGDRISTAKEGGMRLTDLMIDGASSLLGGGGGPRSRSTSRDSRGSHQSVNDHHAGGSKSCTPVPGTPPPPPPPPPHGAAGGIRARRPSRSSTASAAAAVESDGDERLRRVGGPGRPVVYSAAPPVARVAAIQPQILALSPPGSASSAATCPSPRPIPMTPPPPPHGVSADALPSPGYLAANHHNRHDNGGGLPGASARGISPLRAPPRTKVVYRMSNGSGAAAAAALAKASMRTEPTGSGGEVGYGTVIMNPRERVAGELLFRRMEGGGRLRERYDDVEPARTMPPTPPPHKYHAESPSESGGCRSVSPLSSGSDGEEIRAVRATAASTRRERERERERLRVRTSGLSDYTTERFLDSSATPLHSADGDDDDDAAAAAAAVVVSPLTPDGSDLAPPTPPPPHRRDAYARSARQRPRSGQCRVCGASDGAVSGVTGLCGECAAMSNAAPPSSASPVTPGGAAAAARMTVVAGRAGHGYRGSRLVGADDGGNGGGDDAGHEDEEEDVAMSPGARARRSSIEVHRFRMAANSAILAEKLKAAREKADVESGQEDEPEPEPEPKTARPGDGLLPRQVSLYDSPEDEAAARAYWSTLPVKERVASKIQRWQARNAAAAAAMRASLGDNTGPADGSSWPPATPPQSAGLAVDDTTPYYMKWQTPEQRASFEAARASAGFEWCDFYIDGGEVVEVRDEARKSGGREGGGGGGRVSGRNSKPAVRASGPLLSSQRYSGWKRPTKDDAGRERDSAGTQSSDYNGLLAYYSEESGRGGDELEERRRRR